MVIRRHGHRETLTSTWWSGDMAISGHARAIRRHSGLGPINTKGVLNESQVNGVTWFITTLLEKQQCLWRSRSDPVQIITSVDDFSPRSYQAPNNVSKWFVSGLVLSSQSYGTEKFQIQWAKLLFFSDFLKPYVMYLFGLSRGSFFVKTDLPFRFCKIGLRNT